MIVDNIDSETLQQHILKNSEQFHSGYWLFTSRLSQWSPQVANIDLDYFSEQDAREFLSARLEQSFNSEHADQLSHKLGYLPLALEQAAAYQLKHGLSINDYLKLLEQQPETLLQSKPKNYPYAVWETWNLTHHALDEDAQAIMLLLCCFAAEPLPRGVILDQAELITKTLWDQEVNSYQRIDRALSQLLDYSLARNDQGLLIVHRLLHQVTCLQADAELITDAQTLAQACLAKPVSELKPHDVRNWPQLEQLIVHIEYVTSKQETESTSLLLNQLGLLFLNKAQHEHAEPLMRRALSIDEASFGAEHPSVAIRLNNLAQLLQATNRLDEAEPLLRQALLIFQNSLGEEHPNTIVVAQNYQRLVDEMK